MRRFLPVLALALGASAARADNGFFYVGTGIASDSLHDVAPNGFRFGNIHTTSWKALAGLRPIRTFATEVDYLSSAAGSVSPNVEVSAHASYKAFAGYIVGFLPIPAPFLDVYGKAGLAHWSLSGGVQQFFNAPPPSLANSGSEFAWGFGSQIHVGNIGGRLEYETFRIPSTNGISAVSLTVFLSFF